jgi:DNA polymerase I
MTNQPGGPKKILLVDGSNIAFRMYFALERTHLTSPDGRPSWAIFGFMKAVFEVILKEKPTVMVTCFDTSGPTFRSERADFYKANRPTEMPQELQIQWPEIQRGLQLLGVKILKQDGIEADDFIGTLALEAVQAGWEADILSGDKDNFQLVRPGVSILYPGSFGGVNKMDSHAVIAKMGVRPDQIVDFKALAGDSSDNIPGVPGVGEKTAQTLLAQFGDLDSIYAKLNEVSSNAVRAKLEAGKESAYLSQFLATIKTDCLSDFKFTQDSYHLQPDAAGLRRFLAEYKLSSLEKQLPKVFEVLGLSGDSGDDLFSTQSMATDILVDTQKGLEHGHARVELKDLTSLIRPQSHTALEMVPTADGHYVLALCQEQKGRPEVWTCLVDLAKDADELNQLLGSLAGKIYAYDQKRLYKILRLASIHLSKKTLDVMLGAYVQNSSQPVDLPDLIKNKLGSGFQVWTGMDLETYANRAAQNAAACLSLGQKFSAELEGRLPFVWQQIESPLALVLGDMEMRGVYIDKPSLSGISKELARQIEIIEKRLKSDLNEPDLNLNSSQQLGQVLIAKGFALGKTSKGQPSTDRYTLDKLAEIDDTGLIQGIIEYRTLTKLYSTYTESFQTLIGPDGRIHGEFSQIVAATGRLSSINPNLQNIPIKNPVYGKLIRSCFAAEPGNLLIAADYSQVELRFLADLCGDDKLIEAFEMTQDIHARTASEVFEVSIEKVTKDQRRVGKTLNFALLYQQGSFATARMLGVSTKEANQIIEKYFAKFPKVKPFIESTIEKARNCGYVETFWGRRRYFTNLNHSNANLRKADERAAFNAVLQGSNADLIKLSMLDFKKRLQVSGMSAEIILQVHDELVVEAPKEHIEKVHGLLVEAMYLGQPLKVPIQVDSGVGVNWAECKH